MTTIADNAALLRSRIQEAAQRAGRNPADIQLCAATKMQSADSVRQAIAAGVDCCGENRVQELTDKLAQDAYRGAPVHFIGRLQTNKVRSVVGRVALIQSVDRENLLQSLQKEAARQGVCQRILLEVNIAAEPSKGGFAPEELYKILERMGEFPNLKVEGLMAIPPISRRSGENSTFFLQMHNLSVDITAKKYDNVAMGVLSMGMSGDFEDAIECGSTMVRVGTALFGPRDSSQPHP